MPFYEFYCEEHGYFELLRPISLCLEPAPCPICGVLCQRSYTVPNLRQINPQTRNAIDRSVQSRHQPKVIDLTKPKNQMNKNYSKVETTRKGYSGMRSWVVESSRKTLI